MFGYETHEPTSGWTTRLLGPKHHKSRLMREWVVIVLVALVASLVIRTFIFQTFYIPSGSMEPTLLIGDRIVVDKLAVDFGSINRGDIVVFKAPATENCGGEPVVDLVKRVIGLPGDRLSSQGNTIYVNGKPLNEAWSHLEPLGPAINPTTVKPNNYFVMGDNHNNSCDSRYWGTVQKSLIIGKAFVRIWPFNRLGWF
ncbi:MAG: signal peptidase I [Actinomycetota bacterium]